MKFTYKCPVSGDVITLDTAALIAAHLMVDRPQTLTHPHVNDCPACTVRTHYLIDLQGAAS